MNPDGRILVRAGISAWSVPDVSAYDNEHHLQRLIAESPDWIPGVERDAFTVEELSTVGGPIDVCVVGRDGAITVVECKLASNSERRRMVVGQVIDYAAAIWDTGSSAFLDGWQRRTGVDLRDELEDASVAALEHNIAQARIDLCLAVDAIDDDLRRLVEFLNKATRADVRVTALQLAYARHGDTEILIPSTFGGEIAEAKVRASERFSERWTCESFVDALDTEEDRRLAQRIFDLVNGLEERRGEAAPLWFGQRPGGGIYLQPYGLPCPPVWISANSRRQLMMCGTWKSFPAIAHDEAYAQLAEMLGQSHLQGAKGVAVSTLDIDRLWPVLLDCATGITAAAASSGASADEASS